MLLSGSQSIFVNRTHWAVTYLSKAGLVSRPARGRIQITDRTRCTRQGAAKINIAFLTAYPSFEEFRARSRPKAVIGGAPPPVSDQNPEELLYATYDALRGSIEADMLDRLQAPTYPWEAFERYVVVELLARWATAAAPTTRLCV